MMLPVAIVSVLVGSPLPTEAPPGALAPAPAPAELAPAPAPAPAEPAPGSSVVTVHTTTAPSGTTTSTVTVVDGSGGATTTTTTIQNGWEEPAPAPVVVVTPTPEPPLTLSPPAPTWTPVRAPTYVPPDPARVQQTMRQHRRGALAAFAVGSVGMAATLGFQTARVRGLQRCAATASHVSDCDVAALDYAFSRYGALGMSMFVVGSAGAGVMLGNAAATRDVQLRNGDARSRTGLKVLGVVVIGTAVGWMIGANKQLGRHESQCEGDPGCLLRYRPLRLAANDGAAVGIAAGAGMIGYALGYERQGRALMRLRAAPSISARHTGVAMSIEF